MRIARVTTGFPPRHCGWSHHAFHLSRYQTGNGHAVSVFYPRACGMSEIPDIDAYPIGTGPIAWDSLFGRTVFAGLAARRLKILHRSRRIDLIHGHGDIFEALPLLRAARRLGLPLVMTIHGGLSKSWKYRALASYVWPRVDRVIAVNRAIKEDLISLGCLPQHVDVTSSGVDTRYFRPASDLEKSRARQAMGLAPEDFVAAAVGRLHPVKGFRYLIEAAGLAATARLRVLIVGEGEQRLELERRASESVNVRLLGEKVDGELLRILHAADIFVLPSVELPGQVEGTPTAVLEAMSCGLPVLTTDAGGTGEVVSGAKKDVMVPQKSAQALAEALSYFASNRLVAGEVGRQNRLKAIERDWSKVADLVQESYRRAFPEA